MKHIVSVTVAILVAALIGFLWNPEAVPILAVLSAFGAFLYCLATFVDLGIGVGFPLVRIIVACLQNGTQTVITSGAFEQQWGLDATGNWKTLKQDNDGIGTFSLHWELTPRSRGIVSA